MNPRFKNLLIDEESSEDNDVSLHNGFNMDEPDEDEINADDEKTLQPDGSREKPDQGRESHPDRRRQEEQR